MHTSNHTIDRDRKNPPVVSVMMCNFVMWALEFKAERKFGPQLVTVSALIGRIGDRIRFQQGLAFRRKTLALLISVSHASLSCGIAVTIIVFADTFNSWLDCYRLRRVCLWKFSRSLFNARRRVEVRGTRQPTPPGHPVYDAYQSGELSKTRRKLKVRLKAPFDCRVGIVAVAGAIATIVYCLPAAPPLHRRFAAVARLQSDSGLWQ